MDFEAAWRLLRGIVEDSVEYGEDYSSSLWLDSINTIEGIYGPPEPDGQTNQDRVMAAIKMEVKE